MSWRQIGVQHYEGGDMVGTKDMHGVEDDGRPPHNGRNDGEEL